MLINRYGGKGVDFDVHCVVATHHMADEGHDHDSADLDYVVTFNPVASIEKVRSRSRLLSACGSFCLCCLSCLSVFRGQRRANSLRGVRSRSAAIV